MVFVSLEHFFWVNYSMVPGNVMPKGQLGEMVGEGSKEQWKGMGKEGFGRRKQPGKVRGSSFVRPWWMFS